jgi:hypothetical protein
MHLYAGVTSARGRATGGRQQNVLSLQPVCVCMSLSGSAETIRLFACVCACLFAYELSLQGFELIRLHKLTLPARRHLCAHCPDTCVNVAGPLCRLRSFESYQCPAQHHRQQQRQHTMRSQVSKDGSFRSAVDELWQ